MSLHLMKDETVIWKSFAGKKYRLFLFILQFGLGVLLALSLLWLDKQISLHDFIGEKGVDYAVFFVILLSALYAGYNQILFLFLQYYITSERIIIKKGFFSRKLTSVKLENIHDTKVEQSFAERLIGNGHVYIFTANDVNSSSEQDHLNKVPAFKQIDNPFGIHQLLEEAVENNSKQV